MSIKCREAIANLGAYIDRELDPQVALKVEQHLATCENCAREFAEQRKLDTCIGSILKGGSKTEGLWRTVEARVEECAREARFASASARATVPDRVGLRERLDSLGRTLYASLLPSPWAWSALAGVWIVILALNLTARDEPNYSETTTRPPSASQVRFAFELKHTLTADLGLPADPFDKPSREQRRPRSQLSSQFHNA